MFLRLQRWAVLTALLGMLAGVPGAWAGSFQVNPVRIDLTPEARIATVTVTNNGTDSVVVQTRVATWSQHDNKDDYQSSNTLIATPPIATIAPGASQIVRVGLRGQSDAKKELAYRLFVQEVPPPPKPGFKGLQVALRIGIPVFIAPQHGTAKPDIDWKVQRTADGRIEITARNIGLGHVRVDAIRIFGGTGQSIAAESQLMYVLPGHSRTWTLKPTNGNIPTGRSLHLHAQTDAGNVDTSVQITGH
jgi:fimbrial chaperone protein